MSLRIPGSPKTWVAFCLCVSVLLADALCLFAPPPVQAKGRPSRPWAVLAPVSYGNLTIFPVEARDAGATGDYITLDEGIKAGTVQISEKGGAAAARRRVRGRHGAQQVQTGGGDTVNQLTLVNKSGKKLLLLAGEVVVGGNQDRIVQEDLIVPPVSVPVALDVFCVEHGRWSHRAPTGYASPEVVNAAPVVAQAQERTRAVGGGGGGGDTRVVARRAYKPESFSSLGAVAHPKLRAAALDKKEQGEVWKEVAANNQKLGTANGTDTYQEVYASPKVSASMEQYIAALQKEMPKRNIVGVVVARNGELVWSDIFASASLFQKYWPKLLKSYVVDAMGEQLSEKRPTLEQAQNYLARRDGKTTSDGEAGVYRLTRTDGEHYAVFQLEDISLAAPLRVHFNKLQR